ncbi:MAG: peptide deformylase [Candidatus Moraniibacteriota bacterium]|nr:MAG: peptide deformylase [Candidatus Moranbacteria bacterium]
MKNTTLPLTFYPHPVLETTGTKISTSDLESMRQLAKEMTKTMYESKGVGLAAQQIGKALQICVIDVDGNLHTLINPKITSFSRNMHTDDEGCLSIPRKFFPIERHWKVTVRYTDEEGVERKMRASGLLARAVQHELDHLNGIIILDRYHEQNKKR